MKDSRIEDRRLMEIGKIPKGWEVVKIEDIISLEYGKGLTAKQRESGEFPVFGSNGIIGYHSQYLIEAPGIIVGRKGTIGAIAWSEKKFWPIDTTYYVGLKKSNTHLKWLFYKLGSIPLARLNTATGTPGLNRNLVYSLQIPIPPLPEQHRIAEILTTADTAIQKVDDAIAKTERLKRGMMQELLTNGIGHEEFKDSEVGRIPRGWEVVKLSEAAEIMDCKHRTPKYYDEGIPVIRPGNVKPGPLSLNGAPKTSYEEYTDLTEKYKPKKGDIIFARNATVGVASYVATDELFALGQDLVGIGSKGTDFMFLFYLFNFKTVSTQIERLSTGSTFKRINLKKIRNLKLPRPPLSEQHRIAEILSTVDKKLELERKRKEKLERIKKSLMNELLTGKKRVTIAR